MEFIEELLLVKGVTKELYFGTEEFPGLADLVTPYGRDGKININTADPFVLRALSEQIDLDMVDGLLTYRDNEDNDLSDPGWYKSAAGFPGDITIPPDLLTTSSTFFEIDVDVTLENTRRKARGMVVRDQVGRMDLLCWKME